MEKLPPPTTHVFFMGAFSRDFQAGRKFFEGPYRNRRLHPAMGVFRHLDAGYELAAEVAKERGVHSLWI